MATETTIQRPAPFVEKLGTNLAENVLAQQGVPLVSTGASGITQFAGEDAAALQQDKKLDKLLILENKIYQDLHHKLQVKMHYNNKHSL